MRGQWLWLPFELLLLPPQQITQKLFLRLSKETGVFSKRLLPGASFEDRYSWILSKLELVGLHFMGSMCFSVFALFITRPAVVFDMHN